VTHFNGGAWARHSDVERLCSVLPNLPAVLQRLAHVRSCRSLQWSAVYWRLMCFSGRNGLTSAGRDNFGDGYRKSGKGIEQSDTGKRRLSLWASIWPWSFENRPWITREMLSNVHLHREVCWILGLRRWNLSQLENFCTRFFFMFSSRLHEVIFRSSPAAPCESRDKDLRTIMQDLVNSAPDFCACGAGTCHRWDFLELAICSGFLSVCVKSFSGARLRRHMS
jgi:hypothetical protein